MTDTFRIHPLLDGLVDYAGLFPPTRLDMAAAVAEYDAHRRGEAAALVGRFVCPADRLAELGAFADRFDTAHPLRLALVVAPVVPLREALREASAFVRAFKGVARVETAEIRLDDPGTGLALRSRLCDTADAAAPRPVYVELPVAADPEGALRALPEFAPARRAGRFGLGAKLRCGGERAADYPTPEAVASFLYRCVMDGVPFKATAGLHHPVRGRLSPEGPPMHGFLNVFGAAVLGAARGLAESELLEIVSETDPAAFSLEDGRFRWKGHAAPLPAVHAVRAGIATSFGSCSLDEPADDLRALGWLQAYP
jgi:hypothetical protein